MCAVVIDSGKIEPMKKIYTKKGIRKSAQDLDSKMDAFGSPSWHKWGAEEEAQVISTRVCLLLGRLIASFPELEMDQELQLCEKLQKILQNICEFLQKVGTGKQIIDLFDPPIRLLVTLLTKTAALDRLARREDRLQNISIAVFLGDFKVF